VAQMVAREFACDQHKILTDDLKHQTEIHGDRFLNL
jgi:hypothetical protein